MNKLRCHVICKKTFVVVMSHILNNVAWMCIFFFLFFFLSSGYKHSAFRHVSFSKI